MPANRFDELIEHWDSQLRKAFLESVQKIKQQARLDQITKMLENGDIESAVRAVGLDPASFRPFDKTFQAAYEAGGIATADLAPARLQFQFNIRNPAAEDWLRRYSSKLITEVFDDQRQMIRNFLTDGLARGANPRQTALDLVGRIGRNGLRQGGVIGLTETQMRWYLNYAHELIDDPKATLKRALRDKRFDKLILRYAKSDDLIPPETAAKMLRAYQNRALRYRAETIARTETLTALHQAQNQAIEQMIQSGAVTRDQVKSIWRATKDNRVREAHRDLSGRSAPFGAAFHSELGPIRFPGDPEATPANTINCRCWLEPKIDFLAGIR